MAKHQCVECKRDIEGETVWLNELADLSLEDERTWRFVSTASRVQHSPSDRPFHPSCFEERTGRKWPPTR